MSQNILLLSEAKLRERANIDPNVDSKLLINTIKWCQDVYVEPVMGTTLFDKILSDIDNSALTGNYKTLVDRYIVDMLLWFVMAEIPMVINYRMTNKSVLSANSENSQSTTMAELVDIIPYYKKKAEYYEQRAIQYLKQNYNLFTEYTSYGTGVDVIRPKKMGYSCSIPLDVRQPKEFTVPELYQGNGTGAVEDIEILDGGNP
jgi:hypothetical protein